MLCFTQLGYRDVAVTGWDKVERQGSTRLSNAVINLLLFFFFEAPALSSTSSMFYTAKAPAAGRLLEVAPPVYGGSTGGELERELFTGVFCNLLRIQLFNKLIPLRTSHQERRVHHGVLHCFLNHACVHRRLRAADDPAGGGFVPVHCDSSERWEDFE